MLADQGENSLWYWLPKNDIVRASRITAYLGGNENEFDQYLFQNPVGKKVLRAKKKLLILVTQDFFSRLKKPRRSGKGEGEQCKKCF